MRTTTKWLMGLCAGLASVAAHAIPVTATVTSSPVTITQTAQTISFALDLSDLDFDTNTYSISNSNLSLGFTFSNQGNPQGSNVTLTFGGGNTTAGTAAALNNSPISIDASWFDFTSGELIFDIQRNNNSGTLTLSGASFSLALVAEPRIIEQDPIVPNPNNPGNEHSVPEPGTLALLGLGLFGLAMLGRRPRASTVAA